MVALRATSGELEGDASARAELEVYAGPQCFPQLHARFDADAHLCRGEEDSTVPSEGLARGMTRARRQGAEEQMRQCWRQCDACGKWRLLEQGCARLWNSEQYHERLGGLGVNWKRWLTQAEWRYETFLRKHRPHNECEEESQLPFSESAQPVGGRNAAARREDASRGWAMNAGVPPPEAGSAEGSDASEASDHSAAADLAALVGARGGGMQEVDVDALRKLEEAECFELGGRQDCLVDIVFTCDMLMTRRCLSDSKGVNRKWREMCCDDPDDFEAL